VRQVYICWPGGRYKAVTFSYDDGKHADRRLVEVFNKNGIKGTFHINAGLFDDPNRIPASEVSELYRGHEISAHTWKHPTIARCPLDQVALQVLEDRRALERFTDYPVCGLSYPNGSFNADIISMLPGLGIRYGRMVGGTGGFAIPEDPYRWVSTCHHSDRLVERTSEFLSLFKSQYLYWFSIWGHAWEFDRDDNWADIEDVCARLGADDEVWSATVLEAFDYLAAAKRARFSVDLDRIYNPTGISLSFSVDGRAVVAGPGATVRI